MSIFLSKNGKSFFRKTQKVVLKHNAVKMDFIWIIWLHDFFIFPPYTKDLGIFLFPYFKDNGNKKIPKNPQKI
jgi:hypothetical protein